MAPLTLKMVARIVIHKGLSLEPDFQSKNQECKYEVDVVWIKRVHFYEFRLLEGLHRSLTIFIYHFVNSWPTVMYMKSLHRYKIVCDMLFHSLVALGNTHTQGSG